MARLPRLIIAGLPHLVSQRAQHGQVMVKDDADRQAFKTLLFEAARKHGVAVHAYALNDDRFELVATPHDAVGLGLMMQSVSRRHAAAFNRRHDRRGALWEGRYRAAVLDPDTWMLACMVYVEQGAPTGRWTSRDHHGGLAPDPAISDSAAYWALGNTPFEREVSYRVLLEGALTSDQLSAIASALRGGWVLGDNHFGEAFINAARPIRPRKKGRKSNASPNSL